MAAPLVPLPFGRFLRRAEAGDLCFKTGIPEDVSIELIRIVAEEEPEVPRGRTGEYDNARGLPPQELLPEVEVGAPTCFDESKAESGEPHTLEEPLEDRGHTAPPDRVNDDEVVRPSNRFLERL